VPSFENLDKPSPRRGILEILAVQIVVLLAVCGAAIVYINWASDAAQAEFMNALQPSVSGPGNFSPSSPPAQVAKVKLPCARKG
jgi:hypothetical protein